MLAELVHGRDPVAILEYSCFYFDCMLYANLKTYGLPPLHFNFFLLTGAHFAAASNNTSLTKTLRES